MAFVLLGVAISIPVGLATDKVGGAAIVLSIFAMTLGLSKYQQERSEDH